MNIKVVLIAVVVSLGALYATHLYIVDQKISENDAKWIAKINTTPAETLYVRTETTLIKYKQRVIVAPATPAATTPTDSIAIATWLDYWREQTLQKDSMITSLLQKQEGCFIDSVFGKISVSYDPIPKEFRVELAPTAIRIDSVYMAIQRSIAVENTSKWYEKPAFCIPLGVLAGIAIIKVAQ